MPTETRIKEFFPDIPASDEVSRPRRKAAEKATQRMQTDDFEELGGTEELDDDRDEDWGSQGDEEEEEDMDTQERGTDEMLSDMDEDSDYEPDAKKAKKSDAFWVGRRRVGRPPKILSPPCSSSAGTPGAAGSGGDAASDAPDAPSTATTTTTTPATPVSAPPAATPTTTAATMPPKKTLPHPSYTPHRGKSSGVLLQPDSTGNYVCPHCEFRTPQVTVYTQHLVKHGLPSWKCGHCSLRLQNREELQRHINVRHPGEKPIMIQVDLHDKERVFNPISAATCRTNTASKPTTATAQANAQDAAAAKAVPPPPSARTTTTSTPTVTKTPGHTTAHSDTAKTPNTEAGQINKEQPVVSTQNKEAGNTGKTNIHSGAAKTQPKSDSIKLNCPYCSFRTTNLSSFEVHIASHPKKKDAQEIAESSTVPAGSEVARIASPATSSSSSATKKDTGLQANEAKEVYTCGHCKVVRDSRKDILIHLYQDHPKAMVLWSKDTPEAEKTEAKPEAKPEAEPEGKTKAKRNPTARKRTQRVYATPETKEETSNTSWTYTRSCRVHLTDFFEQPEQQIQEITARHNISNINM